MKTHSVPMRHIARQWVIDSGATDLMKKAKSVKNCTAKIELLGSYDPQKKRIIKDPYYGSDEDFEMVYEQCCPLRVPNSSTRP
ncbi:hypothetical protein CRUP_030138, partial [Coryphaenoides rupestris]